MTTNFNNLPRGQQARLFVVIAVFVVAIEAVAYVVLAVLAVADISGDAIGTGIGIALFLVLYGLAQLFAAWKLLSWHSWARGPLLFTQLVQLGLAWGLRDSKEQWLAILMAISAAVALGCLIAPAVTRALLDDDAV
ncbi:MAG: hypothetical protein H7288_18945 [Kineosporiaceae bacterium]|nr:hypothetical protein [Aeromicrobium sp.]